MKKWEIKYSTPNAGASRSQHCTIEASNRNQAEDIFFDEFPLEEIISIEEVVS